jgi:hypothetical protein
MRKALLMLAALAVPAVVAMAPGAAFAQRQRGVADPRAFVAATYARYQHAPNVPPPDRSFAYSEDLGALFRAYDAWSRAHEDLVGALDFDWWTNAQDYRIANVVLTAQDEGAGRRTIVARFDNYDTHQEVRFAFVRAHGRWYLDDASTAGADGWRLSTLLARRE